MERLAAEGSFIGRNTFVYFSFGLIVVEERRGAELEDRVGDPAGGKKEEGVFMLLSWTEFDMK